MRCLYPVHRLVSVSSELSEVFQMEMQVFKALHGLVAFVLFSMHQDGINPIWDAVGYPGKTFLKLSASLQAICLHSKLNPAWLVISCSCPESKRSQDDEAPHASSVLDACRRCSKQVWVKRIFTWKGLFYTGPDPNRPKLPSSDKQQSEAVLMKSIVSLHGKETTSQDLQTRLQAAGLQVSSWAAPWSQQQPFYSLWPRFKGVTNPVLARLNTETWNAWVIQISNAPPYLNLRPTSVPLDS